MTSRPVRFGLTLSSEEHPAPRLVELAGLAEANGFDFVSISDHYHPWVSAQGHSPFVWSVLGGISQRTEAVEVAVGVTCPMVRIHPAVIAQASATTAQLLPGRFTFGVGTGEALNEHIFGDRWPAIDERQAMLAEAVEIVRRLWSGARVTFRGTYYRVEAAQLYDLGPEPVPIVMSAFGPDSAEVAAALGDGLWTHADAAEMVAHYRHHGGQGPVFGQITLCWAPDERDARERATRIWPNSGLVGQLGQDLPTPAHVAQAVARVREEDVAAAVPCGPDPEPVVAAARASLDAGVDHVYFHQVGDDQEGFLRFWREELRPRLATLSAPAPS